MVAGFAALEESAARSQARDRHWRVRRVGARSTASLIGVERELPDEEIELDERHHAGHPAFRTT